MKGIGEAMGESLKQQDTVLDAVDDKVESFQLSLHHCKISPLKREGRACMMPAEAPLRNLGRAPAGRANTCNHQPLCTLPN